MRDSYIARRSMLLAFLALLGLNAFLFSTHTASPLIIADGWSAVDTVVRPAATNGFDVSDLFQKRSANDHSQPLRKLILLFHYHYFDLDFSIESVIGLLFACFNLAILWSVAFSGTGVAYARPELASQLGFAALAAVYLSLNSTVVFSWPLLTLNYTSHTFMLAFLCATWRALSTESHGAIAIAFAAALAMDVVADDTGLIATIAATLAAGIYTWHHRSWRRTALVWVAVLGAYVVYALCYRLLVTVPEHAGGNDSGPGKLLAQASEVWKWVVIPLSSSILHRSHSQAWFDTGANAFQTVLAGAVALTHAWFWWRVLTHKAKSPTFFVAVALMLVFYGLLGGILLVRVGAGGGSDYLWQPRYVMIYQWNLLALLLMGIDYVRIPREQAVAKKTSRAGMVVLGAAAMGLLALQIPLAMSGWNSVSFVSAYQQRMAYQIGALAAHPERLPEKCMAQLVICRFSPARRARLLHFLQQRRLNLFSPSFQARNRLYPDIDAFNRLTSPAMRPPRPARRPDALPIRPTTAAVPSVR